MSSSKQGSVNLTPAMLANIKSTFKNLETFSVNWAGVKDETGVSSNGNAAQGFRNAMKAFDLKIIDSKNWKFADVNDEAPASSTAAPPKTPSKKRGRPKKNGTATVDSPEEKRQKVDTAKKGEEEAKVKQEAEAEAEDGKKVGEDDEVEDK